FNTALSVANGGTGATTAAGARTNLGAAASGANSDITSLSGLTTALSVGQGGTGAATAQGAINNLSGLTTNGDILYHNGTNTTRLARGTNGQCLSSTATSIQWASCGLGAEADTLATVTARGATTTVASSFQGGATIRGLTVDSATVTDDIISVAITSTAGSRFTGTITNADLTANRTWTLPNASGTFITTGNLASITGTGTITSGVWNGTALTDAYVSDTLTSSIFRGTGSTTDAIDLGTAEVAGTLADGNVSDTLTIGAAGTVAWGALNAYPAACAAGSAITALGDTITCSAFMTATASNVFVNGGNSFGAAAVLGTNDTNSLSLKTNGVNRMTIDATGATSFTGSVAAASISTSGNIAATGTISASNFSGSHSGTSSGTNTGDVTVSGQNYITISGQALTVGQINLGGTHVTGALADANVADNITISSAGSVDWAALNNYPAACASGAITALGDTITCSNFATGTAANYIQNGTALQTSANMAIQSATTNNVTVAVRALASQTSDLLQFQASGGGLLGGFNTSGNLYYASGAFRNTISTNALTANRSIALPDASGTVAVSASGNIALSATGDITLVNAPTISGLLTANTGVTLGAAAGSGAFLNNGSTVNTTLALGNLAAGAIGTAAATVDAYSSISIAPTAAGRTYTIPDPTTTTAGRMFYISNASTTNSFTITANAGVLSSLVSPSTSITLIWNGADWAFAGADGSSILNQNSAAQTANFWVSGTGRADTGLTAPNLQRATAGQLLIGTTATTTSMQIGGTSLAGATALTVQNASGATLSLGSNNVARTVNIAYGAAFTTAQTVNIGSTAVTSATNIYGGTGGINIGDSTANVTINIGGVTSSNTSTVNIATNATAADTINVGNSNAGTALSLTAGISAIQMSNNSVNTTINYTSNAYNIQSFSGSSYFTINNSANGGNLITNPSAELNLTGWSARTGTTLTRNTTLLNVYFGAGSVQAANTATANAGVNYAIQLSPNTTYYMQVLVKNTALNTIRMGYSSDGATETNYTDTVLGTTGDWTRIGYSVTTPATVNASAYIFIKQVSATAGTLYLDGLSTQSNGFVAWTYQESQISLGNSATPVVVGSVPAYGVQATTNAALFVQQSRPGVGLIVQGAKDADLYGDPIMAVQTYDGTRILQAGSGGIPKVVISGGFSAYGDAALEVNSKDPGAPATVLRGANGQTANIFDIRDNTDSNIVSVNTDGLTINQQSNNVTLGAELYSGNFSAGWTTTNWTLGGGGTTAKHITGNTASLTNTSIAIATASSYQVSFTVTEPSGSGCNTGSYIVASLGGKNSSQLAKGVSCDGTYTVNFLKTTSTAKLAFAPSSTWNGTISGISIKQITAFNDVAALSVQGGDPNMTLNYMGTTGELRLTLPTTPSNSGQIRLITDPSNASNYASVLINDGAATYFKLTAANDPYGNFTAANPFSINNANGRVTIGNGLTVNGTVITNGAVTMNGTLDASNTVTYSGVGSITGAASVLCITGANVLTKTTGGACTNPSSSAYKENINSMADALSVIGSLRPVSFDWKASSGYTAMNGGVSDYGLIAQEVDAILPEVVSRDENGTIVGLKYEGFIPFLLRGMQQQQGQISSLNDTVSALQSIDIHNGGTINGNIVINGGLQVSGNVTVAGNLETADIYVGGHIVTKGSAPVATTGVALGVLGASTYTPAVVNDGTDAAGTVTVTAGGEQLTSGVLAHITFNKAFSQSYKVVVSGGNERATDLRVYVVKTAAGFDIVTRDAVTAGTQYTFDYMVTGAQN
ncbi:MAG: tail fiber domain-containing protein, partial [Candidatus Saccharimonadales bacterium]